MQCHGGRVQAPSNHVSAKHLQGHLNEYAWGYNQRKSRGHSSCHFFVGLADFFLWRGGFLQVAEEVAALGNWNLGTLGRFLSFAMPHALDGARFKVVWAQEHFETLKSEIATFLNSKPYESIMQKQGELVWANQPTLIHPPVRVGALVGDCVHNLMASLDYVVWELANRYAGRQLIPPPVGTDKPSFPLFDDHTRFTKNLYRLMQYKIPADAIRHITDVQPYNAGYESLFVLYRLVNQDKHRLPLLAVTVLEQGSWSLSVSKDGDPTQMRTVTGSGSSLGLNTNVLQLGANEQANVNVDAQTMVCVTLADGTMPREPVDRPLEQIIKTVANVISRFDAFVN